MTAREDDKPVAARGLNGTAEGTNYFGLLIMVASIFISGCATPGVPKVSIPPVVQGSAPISVRPEWRLAPLGFEAALLDIKRGSTIGSFPGGYSEGSGSFCN